MKLLNRLFKLEEINGKNRCPTYLYRWTLLACRWFSVYVHHFVGDDWSRDMHDHPKRFISIGLKGQYVEETPHGSQRYRAPWVRSFPAHHIHRLRLVPGTGDCWTLVIVLRAVRPWGFWHEGRWIPWKEYVGDEGIADKMKSC
jgi:hypothetical protein